MIKPNHVTTPAALAERWDVSTTCIYDILNRGELPAFRIGKLWRIKFADIVAYEGGGAAQQPTEQPMAAPIEQPLPHPVPNPDFDVRTFIRLERLAMNGGRSGR